MDTTNTSQSSMHEGFIFLRECQNERNSIQYLLNLCDTHAISMEQIVTIIESVAPVVNHCAGTTQIENAARLMYDMYKISPEEIESCKKENVL